MNTLANNEDPDKVPHNAAFHQGPHCLLRQIESKEKEIQFYLEIIICEPFIYIQWTLPSLLYHNQQEESKNTGKEKCTYFQQ